MFINVSIHTIPRLSSVSSHFILCNYLLIPVSVLSSGFFHLVIFYIIYMFILCTCLMLLALFFVSSCFGSSFFFNRLKTRSFSVALHFKTSGPGTKLFGIAKMARVCIIPF